MKYLIFLLSIILTNPLCHSQADKSLFYQDQFNGGVCFAAFGIGVSGTTNATSELFIEPGSTIKKAYLFYGVQTFPNGGGIYDLASPFDVQINGFPISLDTINPIFKNEMYAPGITEWFNYSLFAIDITDKIQVTDTYVSYEIPVQPPGNNRLWFLSAYVVYENSSLPLINPCIYVNEEKMWVPMAFQLNDHNKMNLAEPISLSAVVTGSIVVEDGFFLYVNNDSIGLIGGQDNAADGPPGVITSGHFYHQNNIIYGLDDDTPDVWMDSSDVVANIQSHITDPDSFDLNFDYSGGYSSSQNFTFLDFPHGLSNGIWMMMVNYAPACDATMLNVAFTDTTICLGDSINLIATGGTKYKWEPSTFLDCDTCSNPVCSAEKNIWYTCTITTVDSCSKTLPVFVKINNPPSLQSFIISPDTCGNVTGEISQIVATGLLPFYYSLNGNTNASFSNLQTGLYSLSVEDGNGCTDDSLIFIPSIIVADAGFIADPHQGEVPVPVNFLDESRFANGWIWYINDDTLTTQNPNYIFDEIGTYGITQIVYNNNFWCADTAYSTIKVFLPITIFLPNIITADGDGINDCFLVEIEGGEYIQWHILNRWGQEVYLNEKQIETTNQSYNLWDGINTFTSQPVSDGVYFYRIIVKSSLGVFQIYTGSLTVVG